MGEVLEAVRSSTDTLDHELEDELVVGTTSLTVSHQHPLTSYVNSTQPRTVPTSGLVGAVGAWLAVVYGLCYVVLPTAAATLGLYSNLVGNTVVNTLAFVPTAMLTMGWVALVKPEVVTSLRAKRDPVIAATLGSLLVWFGLCETVDAVQPLTAMPWYESLTFLGLNIVEQGMIGMMLASFVRTPGRAFALGAAFQIVMIAIFAGIIG